MRALVVPRLVAAASSMLALVGCGQDQGPNQGSQAGTVSINTAPISIGTAYEAVVHARYWLKVESYDPDTGAWSELTKVGTEDNDPDVGILTGPYPGADGFQRDDGSYYAKGAATYIAPCAASDVLNYDPDFDNGPGLPKGKVCDVDEAGCNPTIGSAPGRVTVGVAAIYIPDPNDPDNIIEISEIDGGFIYPQPITHEFTCVEEHEPQLSFVFDILRRAAQGSVDNLIDIRDWFCSVKYDCPSTGILADGNGDRVNTLITALACTPGEDAEDSNLVYNYSLKCFDGNVPVDMTDPVTKEWRLLHEDYTGEETIENKKYNNAAYGFPVEALEATQPDHCVLEAIGFPEESVDGEWTEVLDPNFPVIHWNVNVTWPAIPCTEGSQIACTNEGAVACNVTNAGCDPAQVQCNTQVTNCLPDTCEVDHCAGGSIGQCMGGSNPGAACKDGGECLDGGTCEGNSLGSCQLGGNSCYQDAECVSTCAGSGEVCDPNNNTCGTCEGTDAACTTDGAVACASTYQCASGSGTCDATTNNCGDDTTHGTCSGNAAITCDPSGDASECDVGTCADDGSACDPHGATGQCGTTGHCGTDLTTDCDPGGTNTCPHVGTCANDLTKACDPASDKPQCGFDYGGELACSGVPAPGDNQSTPRALAAIDGDGITLDTFIKLNNPTRLEEDPELDNGVDLDVHTAAGYLIQRKPVPVATGLNNPELCRSLGKSADELASKVLGLQKEIFALAGRTTIKEQQIGSIQKATMAVDAFVAGSNVVLPQLRELADIVAIFANPNGGPASDTELFYELATRLKAALVVLKQSDQSFSEAALEAYESLMKIGSTLQMSMERGSFDLLAGREIVGFAGALRAERYAYHETLADKVETLRERLERVTTDYTAISAAADDAATQVDACVNNPIRRTDCLLALQYGGTAAKPATSEADPLLGSQYLCLRNEDWQEGLNDILSIDAECGLYGDGKAALQLAVTAQTKLGEKYSTVLGNSFKLPVVGNRSTAATLNGFAAMRSTDGLSLYLGSGDQLVSGDREALDAIQKEATNGAIFTMASQRETSVKNGWIEIIGTGGTLECAAEPGFSQLATGYMGRPRYEPFRVDDFQWELANPSIPLVNAYEKPAIATLWHLATNSTFLTRVDTYALAAGAERITLNESLAAGTYAITFTDPAGRPIYNAAHYDFVVFQIFAPDLSGGFVYAADQISAGRSVLLDQFCTPGNTTAGDEDVYVVVERVEENDQTTPVAMLFGAHAVKAGAAATCGSKLDAKAFVCPFKDCGKIDSFLNAWKEQIAKLHACEAKDPDVCQSEKSCALCVSQTSAMIEQNQQTWAQETRTPLGAGQYKLRVAWNISVSEAELVEKFRFKDLNFGYTQEHFSLRTKDEQEQFLNQVQAELQNYNK